MFGVSGCAATDVAARGLDINGQRRPSIPFGVNSARCSSGGGYAGAKQEPHDGYRKAQGSRPHSGKPARSGSGRARRMGGAQRNPSFNLVCPILVLRRSQRDPRYLARLAHQGCLFAAGAQGLRYEQALDGWQTVGEIEAQVARRAQQRRLVAEQTFEGVHPV